MLPRKDLLRAAFLHAEQQGAEVTGTYRSQYGQYPLTGRVAGSQVVLRGRYELTGTVSGDEMSGTAQVGQEWPATWRGTRLDSPSRGSGLPGAVHLTQLASFMRPT